MPWPCCGNAGECEKTCDKESDGAVVAVDGMVRRLFRMQFFVVGLWLCAFSDVPCTFLERMQLHRGSCSA